MDAKKLKNKVANPNPVKVLNTISLETIYGECNNHLREMDKRRDQMISWYLVLVGALFAAANIDKLGALLVPGSFALTIIGFFMSLSVIDYRIWHTRYAYTAQLLVALSRSAKQSTEQSARVRAHSELHVAPNSWAHMMTRDWIFKRYFLGTEAHTCNATVLLSAVPFYVFAYYGSNPRNLCLLALVTLYLLLFFVYSAQRTFHEFAECPWAQWLLHGIYFRINLTYRTSDKQPS